MMLSEQILWTPVAHGLPDDEVTVLMFDGEEVWQGWHEPEGWYSCDATPVHHTHPITHWAHVNGPSL